MLRNIIFDMGNVLIKYDPEYFILRLGIESSRDRALLLREIFASSDWPLLDAGKLSEEDLMQRLNLRLPERLHASAHRLLFHWDDPLIAIAGMEEFIQECKQLGLSIYLLSNASHRQKEYWNRVPGHSYFDGTIVSAFTGFTKPMPEIYTYLLKHFCLKAEECLFVDDVYENIIGAERMGMKGFLFEGRVDDLRRTILAMIPEGSIKPC